MKHILKLAGVYLKNKIHFLTNAKEAVFTNTEKSITQYEELLDVDYHQDLSKLQATLLIRQTSGYSGDIRTSGSAEYIRFFVDSGDGYFNAGFTKLFVYDEKTLLGTEKPPRKHLVQLYYSNKSFIDKKQIKVKAILSWNELPPADSEWIPTFGNVCESAVLIKSNEDLIGELLDEVKFPKLFSMDYAF